MQSKAPSGAIVLKRDEWDRLQETLKSNDKSAEVQRAEERARLHELSKQSVAGWNNTIVVCDRMTVCS